MTSDVQFTAAWPHRLGQNVTAAEVCGREGSSRSGTQEAGRWDPGRSQAKTKPTRTFSNDLLPLAKSHLLGFPDPARTLSLGGDQMLNMWAFRRTVHIPAGSVRFSLWIPESPSASHLSTWTHSRLKQSHINSWLHSCMGTCGSCLILLKDTLNACGHSVRSPQGSSKPSSPKPLFSPHPGIGSIYHICLLPSSLPGSWLVFQVYIACVFMAASSILTAVSAILRNNIHTNNVYSNISHI